MSFYKSFLNPWKLYLSCVILFLLFLCIGIPLLSKENSGGEQRPLILLSHALYWLLYGMLIISLIIPFCFRDWFKNYWYVSVSVALICLYLII